MLLSLCIVWTPSHMPETTRLSVDLRLPAGTQSGAGRGDQQEGQRDWTSPVHHRLPRTKALSWAWPRKLRCHHEDKGPTSTPSPPSVSHREAQGNTSRLTGSWRDPVQLRRQHGQDFQVQRCTADLEVNPAGIELVRLWARACLLLGMDGGTPALHCCGLD